MWNIIKYRLYNSNRSGNFQKFGIKENVGLWATTINRLPIKK